MKSLEQGIAQLILEVPKCGENESLELYPGLYTSIFKDEEITCEADLVDAVIQYPNLKPHLVDLFRAIMKTFKKKGVFWVDDIQADAQAGEVIAANCALMWEEDITLFIEFINKCDIDHEVSVQEKILKVWNKWGCTDRTMELISVYCMRSQFATGLIDELFETGVFNNEDAVNVFLAQLKKNIDVLVSSEYDSYEDFIENDDIITYILSDIFSTVLELEPMSEEAENTVKAFFEILAQGKNAKKADLVKAENE